MGLSILNNIPSLVAQNQLGITNQNLQNTLFQLSSGSKINSGADDPAGLSIANGLEANITALTQSAQNVTDGVGLLQTADGALSQVTTLLNRAVTLATEGGNQGLTSAQQNAIQNEFTSITNEINQIGENTTYNDTAVFSSAANGTNMSVFLSDGSLTDANSSAGPTIQVLMPSLSAASLGLGTYATGALDLTGQPAAGNTVTIGNQSYTFESSSGATAANQVAIGSSPEGTLQNLQAAVNGTGSAGDTTYGVGTQQNGSAQITSVTSGSAIIQAISAGTAGNSINLSAMLTSNAGGLVTPLSGGAAVTPATGLLSLTSNPTVQSSAYGTLTLTGAPTTGDTVTVGTNAYTFVASGNASAANDVAIDANGNLTNTLTNLADAITGAGTPSVSAYYSGDAVTAGVTASVTGDALTLTSTTAGVAGNGQTAFSASISHSNGSVTNGGGDGKLGGGTAADTITVGNQIYTFVAANDATATNDVAVGGTLNQTLLNLKGAVNTGTGGSNNTYFSSAGPNGNATISVTGNTATVTATVSALASQPTVTFGATGTISGMVSGTSGGNLSGGSNAVAASTVVSLNTQPAAGDTMTMGGETYTFTAANGATAANDVALGSGGNANANLLQTMTNLENAVTGGGTAGTATYGINTQTNSNVTATGAAVNGSTGVGTFTVSALTAGAAGNNFSVLSNLGAAVGGVVGSGMAGGSAAAILSNPTAAQAALVVIQDAISTVAANRGTIGAGINQMNAALSVLNNTTQNLTASESGIQDANIGQVISNMSKYQVLEQTGIASLAQSNTSEQAILKLLP